MVTLMENSVSAHSTIAMKYVYTYRMAWCTCILHFATILYEGKCGVVWYVNNISLNALEYSDSVCYLPCKLARFL